jgi:hypothetical protein
LRIPNVSGIVGPEHEFFPSDFAIVISIQFAKGFARLVHFFFVNGTIAVGVQLAQKWRQERTAGFIGPALAGLVALGSFRLIAFSALIAAIGRTAFLLSPGRRPAKGQGGD